MSKPLSTFIDLLYQRAGIKSRVVLNVPVKVAELLEVDGKKLKWTFTNYCVVTGGEAIRGKNTLTEAEETRASLARSLYCRLFDWIVNLINTKLSYMRLVL